MGSHTPIVTSPPQPPAPPLWPRVYTTTPTLTLQVATDFVSPDHVSHVCRLAADRRLLPPTHGRKTDVLGYETLLFNAACAAAHALGDGGLRGQAPAP